MAGNGSRWVWGCGIGCAGLLLLGALVVVGLVTATRSSLKQFRVASDWADSLQARFPEAAAWVPPPGGLPAPDRWEVFLAVRDSVLPAERAMVDRLRRMHETAQGPKTPGRIWRLLRGGLSSVDEMGRLAAARNRALLAAGMSPVEFAWWSFLVYHGWLGRPLFPPDLIDRRHVKLNEQVPRLRRLLRTRFLALADSARAGGLPADWLAELDAEQSRLIRDPDRMPWQDGVPRRLAVALVPWRKRLEAAASPLACFTAMLDFSPRARKKGVAVSVDGPGGGRAQAESRGGGG